MVRNDVVSPFLVQMSRLIVTLWAAATLSLYLSFSVRFTIFVLVLSSATRGFMLIKFIGLP